jgi:predicted ArsR family transcriptional regulator
VDELAHALKQTPIALRYHLNVMAREGSLTCASAPRHTVGRPQLAYALADQARNKLPRGYHDLAPDLVAELVAMVGKLKTRRLFRRLGTRIAAQAPEPHPRASLATRLKRATDFLNTRGYLARWEKSAEGLALHICNCPYHEIAREYEQVCEMDIMLVGALLGTPVTKTGCLAAGDCRCSFYVG